MFGFGENEQWCDQKYDPAQAVNDAAAAQLRTLNSKCKQSAIFEPWTIAGRIERGLIDDSQIKALVKAVQGSGAAPGTRAATPSVAARADMLTYGLVGLVALGGAFVLLGGKKGRRGSRRRRR